MPLAAFTETELAKLGAVLDAAVTELDAYCELLWLATARITALASAFTLI